VKLSFCAIVKNEAKNLGRCLASVKPYVDELIVVDTGSTDNTIAIAQRYGAKIGHFEWCNDFAAARNYANSLVTGDWILTLDADEELIVHSKNHFLKALSTGIAYVLVRRENGVHDTELQVIRLFKHLSSMEYRYPYHEHLFYEDQPLANNHPHVQPLACIEVMHYGYAEEVLVEKSISRLPMLEQLRATEGLSLMVLWSLSGMYEATHADDQAQDCYVEAWERLLPNLITGDFPQDARSVPSWLYSLAVRSLQSEDIETSQLICEQGMQWFPEFPPLFYLNGLILRMLGASTESIPYFEHCIEAGQTGHYSKIEPFDQALIKLYPAFDLGTVYLELQQLEKAIAAFTLALSFDPNHIQAQEQLAIAQQKLAAA
jgi:glycosyltransferase involved in cell wall biosynthesis